VFGVNSTISEWERLLGKSSSISDEIDRYEKVTKEDVARVLGKYIKGSGAAILNTYPIMNDKDSVKSINPHAGETFPPNPEYAGLTYSPNPDKFDRSVRPTPGAFKPAKVPDYYTSKMQNGLTVIGTKNNETPLVTLVLRIDGGSLVLPADQLKKLGVAELTANILNEGTKNFTTEQVSAELEKLGSSIAFNASKENTIVRITCLNKNLDATLKLLEEKLLNPGFRDDDFKLVKKQFEEDIKNQFYNPELTAQKNFDFAIYGSSVMGLFPTIKSVENIDLKDLKDFYNNYYSPSVASLIIVGNVDEKEITPKLEFLKKWQAKDVKIQPIPEPVPTTEPQFFLINKTAASSSVIIEGYSSLKYDATGDFYKNRIANFAFGENSSSRLFLDLREQKGYTYGIYSNFSGTKYTGDFTIFSSVKRSATAASLAQISRDFNDYVTNGITDAELDATKSSMLNEEALKYEAPYQKASFLSRIVEYNLDKDFTAKQNAVLKSITKAEVNAQIKKYFDANKLTTVVVGDKAYIEAQLDKASKDPKNKDILSKIKFKKLQ
jgi:zinc protease